jgi:hypothetical protein
MNNDLTIILFILDRSDFTLRFLKYYNSLNIQFKLIIGDGGKNVINHKIKSEIKKNSKIFYKKFTNEFDLRKNTYDYNKFFFRKIECLKLVRTKYVKFISDDDFLITSTLKKSIKFLNNNKDYFGAGGPLIDFQIKGDRKYGVISNLSYNYNLKSINYDTKIIRIKKFLTQVHYIWHYVCNTKKLLKIYKISSKFSKNDDHFKDIFHAILCVAEGKLHRFYDPIILHECHNEIHDGANRERHHLLRIKDKNFLIKLEELANNISKETKIKNKFLLKYLYYNFLIKSLEKEKVYSHLSKKELIAIFIKQFKNKFKKKNINNFDIFTNNIKNIKIRSEMIEIRNFLLNNITQ